MLMILIICLFWFENLGNRLGWIFSSYIMQIKSGKNANQQPTIWRTTFFARSVAKKSSNCLRDGKDVVLHAPTGAGKTYVFEQLIESGWKGRAVYTVPTQADSQMEIS